MSEAIKEFQAVLKELSKKHKISVKGLLSHVFSHPGVRNLSEDVSLADLGDAVLRAGSSGKGHCGCVNGKGKTISGRGFFSSIGHAITKLAGVSSSDSALTQFSKGFLLPFKGIKAGVEGTLGVFDKIGVKPSEALAVIKPDEFKKTQAVLKLVGKGETCGTGFFSSFVKGFTIPFKAIKSVAAPLLAVSAVTGLAPEAAALVGVSDVVSTLGKGSGNTEGNGFWVDATTNYPHTSTAKLMN